MEDDDAQRVVSAAEDAGEAARELRRDLEQYPPSVLGEVLRARELALAVQQHGPVTRRNTIEEEDDEDEMDSHDGDGVSDDNFPVDGGNEEAGERCQGLLDDKEDASADSCLQRAKNDYGLDLRATVRALGADFYARLRLVNFMRSMVAAGGHSPAAIVSRVQAMSVDDEVLQDRRYLKPVIDNDPLLSAINDDLHDDDDDAEESMRDADGTDGYDRAAVADASTLESDAATLRGKERAGDERSGNRKRARRRPLDDATLNDAIGALRAATERQLRAWNLVHSLATRAYNLPSKRLSAGANLDTALWRRVNESVLPELGYAHVGEKSLGMCGEQMMQILLRLAELHTPPDDARLCRSWPLVFDILRESCRSETVEKALDAAAPRVVHLLRLIRDDPQMAPRVRHYRRRHANPNGR